MVGIFVAIGFIILGVVVLLIVLQSLGKLKLGTKLHVPAALVAIFGLALVCSPGYLIYVEPGMSYLIQYPTGKQVAAVEPGFKFTWLGVARPWKKVLSIVFSQKRTDSTGWAPPYELRFNDAVTAEVSSAVRMRLPNDPETFIRMAVDFRTQENLVNVSLVPIVKEVMRNSARMISAQEYIKGKGGEFEFAVRDQLENGTYRLETIEGTMAAEEELTEIEVAEKESGAIGSKFTETRTVTRNEVRVKMDNEGKPLRNKHAFNQYNIQITQATIANVDPDPGFKEKLQEQRNAAAEANIARQRATQAEYKRQQIIAEGETEKAQKRVEQEKAQIEILVAAESMREKARVEKEQREIEVEAAELQAKSIQILADAEAKKKKLLMEADGALQARIDAMVEIARIQADVLKAHKLVPDVVVGGAEKGMPNSAALIDLITATQALKLGLEPTNLKTSRAQ